MFQLYAKFNHANSMLSCWQWVQSQCNTTLRTMEIESKRPNDVGTIFSRAKAGHKLYVDLNSFEKFVLITGLADNTVHNAALWFSLQLCSCMNIIFVINDCKPTVVICTLIITINLYKHRECFNEFTILSSNAYVPFSLFSIEPDLRQTVYCTAIGDMEEDAWDFLFQEYQKISYIHFEERRRIRDALGCSRQKWVLSR